MVKLGTKLANLNDCAVPFFMTPPTCTATNIQFVHYKIDLMNGLTRCTGTNIQFVHYKIELMNGLTRCTGTNIQFVHYKIELMNGLTRCTCTLLFI